MQIIGYSGWYWTDNDEMFAGVETLQPSVTLVANILPRFAGAPALAGGQLSESIIECAFGVDSNTDVQTAFDTLFRRLDPTNVVPRDLVAIRHDGVVVRRPAIVTVPAGVTDDGDVSVIRVVFTSVDPAWERYDITTSTKDWNASAINTRQSLPVRGSAPVSPAIRVTPLAQRPAGGTATVGWRWKRQITFTNNSVNNVYRYPWRILMDTAVEVAAGRMQADGDDLRIRFMGEDLPRIYISSTFNTANTEIWFLIPAMAPGESVTVDVMYGNSVAGEPPLLVYPDRPAFDLGTSTNAIWDYNVAETAVDKGLGLWWTELETGADNRVARISYDVPGAWRPYLLLDNADDKGQPNVVTYTVSSVVYAGGRLYATRYRGGASTDLGLGKGQGDGIALYNPLGVISIVADWKITNQVRPATGLAVGKFVVRSRNTGGEEWIGRHADTAIRATATVIAQATYPTANNPHVYIGVLPRDEIEIPAETIYNINILAQTNSVFQVTVNSAGITASSLSARNEVYDMQHTLVLRTASGEPYPYQELQIGRESFPVNFALDIDGPTHTARVIDDDGVTVLRNSPWAINAVVVELDDLTGLEVRRPARDWLRVAGTDVIPGFSFEDADDILAGRWGTTMTDTQLTVTWTRVSTTFIEGLWSLRANIVTNSGGIGGYLTRRTYEPYFRIRAGERVRYAAELRVGSANIMPKLRVAWYDAAQAELSGTSLADWTPTINTWYGRELLAIAPTNAAYYRLQLDAIATIAGATGTAFFDSIGHNGADVQLIDNGYTNLRVAFTWKDAWLS